MVTTRSRTAGELYAWGKQCLQQPGDARVLRVGDRSDWVQVAAGGEHSLGVTVDGCLYAWGDNKHGRLGLGHKQYQSDPMRVGGRSDWVQVSAGAQHSLGTTADGALHAWGHNRYWQLGLGDKKPRLDPVRVGGRSDWVEVAACHDFSLAITADGCLYAWGDNSWGRLGVDYSYRGRAGLVRVGGRSDWVQVSAGFLHSLGVTADGSLYAWGANQGRLGVGDMRDRLGPVQVEGRSDWARASAGGGHSLGITAEGCMYAWGGNEWGELGFGDKLTRSTPMRVGERSDWVQVSAGHQHSLGVTADGCLYAWGNNLFDQLGVGGDADATLSSPVSVWVGDRSDWVQVSAGNTHSLGVATTAIPPVTAVGLEEGVSSTGIGLRDV